MKKWLLALSIAAVALAPQTVGAESFGIVEWTTEGVAMGGARMFGDNDPGNLAYNPAAITMIEGGAYKFSATYISPHGRYTLEGVSGADGGEENGRNVVHPAWVPGAYFVKQLNAKDWFGIGAFTRFGMLSEFERNSLGPSTNAFFSKLNGLSVTPTYAHKFDKKWSAAVGADINYVGLELQKNAFNSSYGTLVGSTQTKGTSYALGWNAAATYAFDEKNDFGIVYRSRIKHSMEADTDVFYNDVGQYINGVSGLGADAKRRVNAYGTVTLPDSWAFGYNHRFDKKTRVELNATRTNWSVYDALNIYFDQAIFPGVTAAESAKNYSDVWRYAIGLEHKFSEKYTGMLGFAFDDGAVPYDGGDFIVPTGLRRTYSIGARYNDKKQALALAVGLMDIGDICFKGHESDNYTSAYTHNNYAKIYSISYERHF